MNPGSDEARDLPPIEDVIRQRIEGIKLRKPEMVRDVIDIEVYSRFDDWPPGLRIEGEDALRSEADALKVLDGYQYSINDLKVNVKDEFAWASLYLYYEGSIRKRSFAINSRVSILLLRVGSQWKIVHEHFSMRPETFPSLATKPSEKKAEVPEEPQDELGEAILKILGDGAERSVYEISQEVTKIIGREIPGSKVDERCSELASKGFIERRGWRFYPRFRIKQRQ